ncbi:MAG: metallophosphoesterase family protein [Spirochaetota bacterium]
MKTLQVLAVSDRRHRALDEHFEKSRWRDIDLVISAGDLDPGYLSFLVTLIPAPLVYVPGNHDQAYLRYPPEGCDSVDGRALMVSGVLVAGLGGSAWYNGKELQYTEKQMAGRVRRLTRRIRRWGRLDILVTHAPPRDIHDQEDRCHRGFASFRDILDRFHPQVLVHGHTHQIYRREDREMSVNGTRVINACGYWRFSVQVED